MKRVLVMALLCAHAFILKAQNTFPSSGNVGIGITSPQWLLDVNGTINSLGLMVNGTYPSANFAPLAWGSDVSRIQNNVTSTGTGVGNYLSFINTSQNRAFIKESQVLRQEQKPGRKYKQ